MVKSNFRFSPLSSFSVAISLMAMSLSAISQATETKENQKNAQSNNQKPKKERRLLPALESTIEKTEAEKKIEDLKFSVGQKLKLSQSDVARLVLERGLSRNAIDKTYEQSYNTVTKALTAYDWKITAEAGYENDKSATLASSDLKFERFKTSASLSKSILTGTSLTLEFSRLSQLADVPASLSSTNPPRATLDSYGVSVEQSLWGNSFGMADRSLIRASNLAYEATKIKKLEDIEDLSLSAISAFWAAYVAQEQFKQNVSSRDSYVKLAATVRQKTGYGYTAPGELNQTLAEVEVRQQKVKDTAANFLKQREALLNILDLPLDTQVEFVVPRDIPNLPDLKPVDLKTVREFKNLSLTAEAAEEILQASKSKSHPTFNLVGKLYETGADTTSESAMSNALSSKNPKYYVGVKFTYNFGSDAQDEDVKAATANSELTDIKLKQFEKNRRDQISDAERNVQTAYAKLISVSKERELREKAVDDLTRAYNQGRTEIRNLIDAMNKMIDSQFNFTSYLGAYHTSLNQWAALRDELLKDN